MHNAGGGGVEGIGGGRSSKAAVTVGGIGIVEQLILGGAPVNAIVIVRAAVENAAVAALTDFPFHFQLEVRKGHARDQITDRALLREDALVEMPAARELIGFPTAPLAGVIGLQQRTPLPRLHGDSRLK